jgi:hypothetical protein
MWIAAVILIIALVAGVILGTVVARKHTARQEGRRAARDAAIAEAEGPGRVKGIRVGDVIGLDGAMWTVEGTLSFDEDGFVWREHLLSEGGRRTWLSVEDDEDGLSVIRWDKADLGDLDPEARSVTFEGVEYEVEERGKARYTGQGTTGTPPSGNMEYADFRGPEKVLGFERYTREGSWELSVGTHLEEEMVDVYPGGGSETSA